MGKVTNEMMRAGSKAYLDAAMQTHNRAECDWGGLLAAYRAMRAARPAPTPTTERTCWYCVHWRCPDWFDVQSHNCPSGCLGKCDNDGMGHEATDTCKGWTTQAAPTPQPSEELRLLRELAEAARDARTIRHYTAWLDYALAALDAAEGKK